MGKIIIVLTLLLAITLDVYAWPDAVRMFMPPFVFLTLGYWCIHAPRHVGLSTVFLASIVLDVVADTYVGHHSVAYLLLSYVLIRSHRTLRVNPLWQQCFVMAAMVLAERLIYYWISVSLGMPAYDIRYLWCVPVVVVLWPLIFSLCFRAQRFFWIY